MSERLGLGISGRADRVWATTAALRRRRAIGSAAVLLIAALLLPLTAAPCNAVTPEQVRNTIARLKKTLYNHQDPETGFWNREAPFRRGIGQTPRSSDGTAYGSTGNLPGIETPPELSGSARRSHGKAAAHPADR